MGGTFCFKASDSCLPGLPLSLYIYPKPLFYATGMLHSCIIFFYFAAVSLRPNLRRCLVLLPVTSYLLNPSVKYFLLKALPGYVYLYAS